VSDAIWGAVIGLAGVAFGLWQRRAARTGSAEAEATRGSSPDAGPGHSSASPAAHAEQRWIQSQRLEAIGRLAGGVAHDFNNLLGVIIGHSELARTACDKDPGVRRRLDQVLAAAQRAADLTRQLLAFSRRQVLEPRVIDVNALVQEIEPAIRRMLGEDVSLVVRLAPGLGRVLADRDQLAQVLLNLASHARDELPAGGTVAIETTDRALDVAYAREHEPLDPGAYVELRVSHDGASLDDSVRRHVFEPFISTRPDGGGPGLSLSTVYGIVKQSGGYVWAETAAPRGMRFTIQLPRRSEAADAAQAPVVSAEPAGTQTILVVEDQDDLRSLICEILDDAGYRVLSAASGPAALTLSQSLDEPIHLLITDVIMPSMRGTELALRIAERRPQTRALLISGYTQDVIDRHGSDPASFPLLRKPFTVASLLTHVRNALGAETKP
jgi:signal transduction histidine kinase